MTDQQSTEQGEAIVQNEPWLQLTEENESNLWYSRFVLFRDMGPVRTMIGALRLEDKAAGRAEHKGITGSWRDAAKRFHWDERAEAYDKYRRQEVFTTGYAYDLNRVTKLDELAAKIEEKLNAALEKMKPSKGGFPDFMITQYLAILEALAKETGGRATVKASDVNVNVSTMNRVVFFDPEAEPDGDIDLVMPVPEGVVVE